MEDLSENCPPVCAQHDAGVHIEGSSTVVEFNGCNIYDNEAAYVSHLPSPAVTAIPAGHGRPFRELSLCVCAQYGGGGVRINGGDVTFSNCEIYSNTAGSVR